MEKKKYLLTRYNFLSKNTILLLIIFIFTTFILPVYAQKETICSWCDTCNYCQYIGMEIKNDYVTINVNFGINIEKYPDLKKLTVIIPNKFESLQLTQEKNKTGYVVAYSISYPDVRKEYDVNITPINDMTKAIFDLSPGCLSYYGKMTVK